MILEKLFKNCRLTLTSVSKTVPSNPVNYFGKNTTVVAIDYSNEICWFIKLHICISGLCQMRLDENGCSVSFFTDTGDRFIVTVDRSDHNCLLLLLNVSMQNHSVITLILQCMQYSRTAFVREVGLASLVFLNGHESSCKITRSF